MKAFIEAILQSWLYLVSHLKVQKIEDSLNTSRVRDCLEIKNEKTKSFILTTTWNPYSKIYIQFKLTNL